MQAAASLLRPHRPARARGFTLFEVLIAMILLGMISAMIYSVLNVGITFATKGDKAILAMDQELSFLSLLQRQVDAAWYDERKREPRLSSSDGTVLLVTRNPFLGEGTGVVLAVYRYSEEDSTVYYLEKKDFYNIDYAESYTPDLDEMTPLFRPKESFSMEVDSEESALVVALGDTEYRLVPRCREKSGGVGP